MIEKLMLSGSELKVLLDSLSLSQHVSLVQLDERFIIKAHNPCFSELIGQEDLSGTPLKKLLLPESCQRLDEDFSLNPMPVRLEFFLLEGESISLEGHIGKTDMGYLLLGQRAILSDSQVLRKMTALNNEMAALTRELDRNNRALKDAQEQIKVLSGIIPICMYCKEIRDDAGYWNQLEIFIEKYSEAKFSHGICDKCIEERFFNKPPDGTSRG